MGTLRDTILPSNLAWLEQREVLAEKADERLGRVLAKQAEARAKLEADRDRELASLRARYGDGANAGAEAHVETVHRERLAELRAKQAPDRLAVLEEFATLAAGVGQVLEQRLSLRVHLRETRRLKAHGDELEPLKTMQYRAAAAQILAVASDSELRGWAAEARDSVNPLLAAAVVAEFDKRSLAGGKFNSDEFLSGLEAPDLEERRESARKVLGAVEASLAKLRTTLFREGAGVSPASSFASGLRRKLEGQSVAFFSSEVAELRALIGAPPEVEETPERAMARGLAEKTRKAEPESKPNGQSDAAAEAAASGAGDAA